PRAAGGSYVLSLEGPRAPTPPDAERIAAEKAFERAASLYDQGTAKGFAAARVAYAEAARRFAPFDPRQEAMALHGVSATEFQLGLTVEGQQTSERVLALARRTGDRALQALALARIAYLRFLREGRPEALEPQRQAAALFLELPSPRDRANAYDYLAYSHWLL